VHCKNVYEPCCNSINKASLTLLRKRQRKRNATSSKYIAVENSTQRASQWLLQINHPSIMDASENALSENSLPLPVEQAYARLKNTLIKNKCIIIEEKPPKCILVKQGSLNGIRPKSAKKTVNFYLFPEGTGTKITSSTKIASDWTNLTLIGNILAAVLTAILLWIAADIENYMQTAKPNSWTWLAQAHGYPDLQYTTFMINLTRATAIFLALTIAVEILIVIYVYPRKNAFAQETLQSLRPYDTHHL